MADAVINVSIKTDPAKPLDSLIKQSNESEKAIDRLSGAFGKMAGVLAGVAALKGTFDFVLNATKQMEDLTSQFVRFTGSTDAARKHLEALQNIPGPSLEEITTADKALLNFGVSADKSANQLKELNDVAITTGTKIGDLAEIFGKIQEEGNLTAESFSKLSKQLPGFATDFSNAIGISKNEFKELAKEGKITATEVLSALHKMTSEGGKFFGATETSAATLTGSFNALSDSLTKLAAKFGEGFAPTLAKAANATASFVERLVSAKNALQTVADDPALSRISKLNDEIKELAESMDDARKKSKDPLRPWEWKQDDLKDVEKLEKRIEGLKRARQQIEEIASKKGFEATTEKIDSSKQSDIDKENDAKREKQRKLLADLQAEADKAAQAQTDKILETQRKITEIESLEAAVRLELEKERAAGKSEQDLAILTEREAELTSARIQAEADRSQLLLQYDQAEILRAQDKHTTLLAAQKKAEADRLAIIKKAKEEEFSLAKITATQEKKFQEATILEKLNMISNGLNAFASLSRSKSRELALIGKAAAIAQTAIAIPQAAQAAYTAFAFAPPLAILAAAAATVSGLERLNTIRSTPIGFSEGGMVPGFGNKDTIPALLTPGEVVVPKSNFKDLQDGLGSSGAAADQVVLLQQGNAIQAKILDQITFGTVNEKLTIMTALLSKVVDGIDRLASAAYSSARNDALAEDPQIAIGKGFIEIPEAIREGQDQANRTKATGGRGRIRGVESIA